MYVKKKITYQRLTLQRFSFLWLQGSKSADTIIEKNFKIEGLLRPFQLCEQKLFDCIIQNSTLFIRIFSLNYVHIS